MRRKARWIVACMIVAGSIAVRMLATCAADEHVVAIEADVIYTMTGEPLTGGVVIIRDGRIEAVGEQLAIPLGSQRLRVATLMPGFIDASSAAGIAGGSAEQTSEVTPEMNILPTLDWLSRDFLTAVDEGTTTLHILPGTANVFAGGSCIVKSAGNPGERVLVDRAGSVVAVCSDPTAGNSSRSRPDSIYVRQPTNRMGVIWIIRARLREAQITSPSSQRTVRMESLQKLLSGDEPMFAVSRAGHDIQSVLTLRKEFGFQPIIVGGEEAYRVLEELAREEIPVIYQGMTSGAVRGPEGTSLFWNLPGQCEELGVVFCLAGGRLLDQARFAVRFGASERAALEAITITPAQLLNIDNRVGTIAAGKDADLVGLDGPPLEATTQIEWTMVNGRHVIINR